MGDTFRAVVRHTPLMLGLVVGLVTAAVLALADTDVSGLNQALIAWDAAAFVYLITVLVQTQGINAQTIIDHAADVDDGRYFVLFVSLAAVIASLTAIVVELQSAAAGADRGLHVGFVFLTVAISWLFVHTSFAKHYAHEYFGPADEGGIRKGLIFPGDEPPDFGDFFHFALVIGVAAQTADIQIAAKPIRRVVTLHGVLAFVFNTVVLALTLSLVGDLFG
jgi:uncharacterized membrane protein